MHPERKVLITSRSTSYINQNIERGGLCKTRSIYGGGQTSSRPNFGREATGGGAGEKEPTLKARREERHASRSK